MSRLGTIDSLWRYPVKSMRGEELEEMFIGFAGVYGDRIFAFTSSASPEGFPYLTGREQKEMLRYRPRFRHAQRAVQPVNLAAAEKLTPGVTPLYADLEELIVDVETPSGEVLAIDDPALVRMLTAGIEGHQDLTLIRSQRALTDCRPVSLFSIQTARALGEKLETDLDERRFRANIYVDLSSAVGFGEDQFVGRTLRVGSKAELSIIERDPRCKMITLDPDTAQSSPRILKAVAQANDSTAGVYAAVRVEGTIRRGDQIESLN